MKKQISTFLLITSALFTTNVIAAEAEVTWGKYKEFRDIKSADGGDTQFREIVFSNLEKHFTQLAETLPEKQKLIIKVTNVDLAGDTHIAGVRDIRVVKHGYPPRMSFSYQLIDSDGSVLLSGDADIKDLNFITNSRLKYRNDSFGHEKKMLDDWFKDTFSELKS